MCNFFKHEVDMVERKYKCREKIDATYIHIYIFVVRVNWK